MKVIDKTLHAHTIVALTAAIIGSPNFPIFAAQAKTEGRPIEEIVNEYATAFSASAIRGIEESDLFTLPRGSGLSDAVMLFIEGSTTHGRAAYEDTLQEGELAQNAAALLLMEPERWISDGQNGDDVPYPGSDHPQGPERINTLIRAAAYVLAEISRLERAEIRAAAYASAGAERGEAILPEGAAPTDETPTQH